MQLLVSAVFILIGLGLVFAQLFGPIIYAYLVRYTAILQALGGNL